MQVILSLMVRRGQGLHTVIHKFPLWLSAPYHTDKLHQVGDVCMTAVFLTVLKLREKSKLQEHYQAHLA